MKTRDQKFYSIGDRDKAEIDVCFTHENLDAPSLKECRHAVLQLKNDGYVVYDRILCRIVNGVFSPRDLESALHVARSYNTNLDNSQDMTPNGEALGLIYPESEERA